MFALTVGNNVLKSRNTRRLTKLLVVYNDRQQIMIAPGSQLFRRTKSSIPSCDDACIRKEREKRYNACRSHCKKYQKAVIRAQDAQERALEAARPSAHSTPEYQEWFAQYQELNAQNSKKSNEIKQCFEDCKRDYNYYGGFAREYL